MASKGPISKSGTPIFDKPGRRSSDISSCMYVPGAEMLAPFEKLSAVATFAGLVI